MLYEMNYGASITNQNEQDTNTARFPQTQSLTFADCSKNKGVADSCFTFTDWKVD